MSGSFLNYARIRERFCEDAGFKPRILLDRASPAVLVIGRRYVVDHFVLLDHPDSVLTG